MRRYGPHPSQVAEPFEPAGEPCGVALVLHGGFWRERYDRHLMDALCRDLAARGWLAHNLEYRRLGAGGGWPATFEDVETASGDLSPGGGPCVAIGHSAGGQLALWAAARGLVTHAVSQAGVVDLSAAAALGLSDGAADELVGGDRSRFAEISPAALLPLGVPQLLVHGEDDDTVPVSLSAAYAERARAAGDAVDLVTLPGVGHYEHLDPASDAWRAVVEWLP